MTRLSAILMGAALFASTSAHAATGDVNADGQVSFADAALTLRFAGGLAAPTFAQLAAADMQPDGRTTLLDAVRIARTAAGSEPPPPNIPLFVTASLTITGRNATMNVALPGGYPVSGRARDRKNLAFDGGMAFRATDGVIWGPADFGSLGDYAIALPPGTYQPFILTRRTDYTQNGEETVSNTSVSAGTTLAVSGPAASVNYTRPDVSTARTVTFDFSGPSRPFGSQAEIYLTDTDASGATGGLNSLRADVLFTPTDRFVPPGTYWVNTRSYHTLATGLTEELYLAFHQTLGVPGTSSRTLSFPIVHEIAGDFTGPNGPNALDYQAEQIPPANGDKATAYVPEQFGGYLVEIPAGNYTASVFVATNFTDTTAEFLLPFTMPSRSATRDISLPALPTFRTVTGVVLAPDGTPQPNARIRIDSAPKTIPTSGLYAYHGDTTTDDNGLYSLALPDGDYVVSVAPEVAGQSSWPDTFDRPLSSQGHPPRDRSLVRSVLGQQGD